MQAEEEEGADEAEDETEAGEEVETKKEDAHVGLSRT